MYGISLQFILLKFKKTPHFLSLKVLSVVNYSGSFFFKSLRTEGTAEVDVPGSPHIKTIPRILAGLLLQLTVGITI